MPSWSETLQQDAEKIRQLCSRVAPILEASRVQRIQQSSPMAIGNSPAVDLTGKRNQVVAFRPGHLAIEGNCAY